MNEHEYCYAEWHRCDGGGPGEYSRYVTEKKWRTIVVDPPWAYNDRMRSGNSGFGTKGAVRGAANHYDTMSLDKLRSLPVGDWAEDDY